MESSTNGETYSRVSSSPTGVNINPSTFSGSSSSSSSSINNNLLSSNAPQHLRRYTFPSASTIIRAPLSAFLEYSGLLRSLRPTNSQDATTVVSGNQHPHDDSFSNNDEVSIRIIASNDHEGQNGETSSDHRTGNSSLSSPEVDTGIIPSNTTANESSDGATSNGRDSYQRYDIQQAAKWLEQILPFSLLLMVVFIRQHLLGFLVSIWVAVVLCKSNDVLKKQTSLKGERKFSVLLAFSFAFLLHVVGVYWWYQDDDLLYPLIMLPPQSIPPFCNAIFIILVNDALVRQASMVLKCLILIFYKNSRGQAYRKQGQMLTLVEYLVLLYRALLPTPIWYRFFLNKEYGSLFSSLMTGLYLTFKLTYVVEKVQSFITAVKSLSRKEVHFGAYATAEQVVAAGDLCAICQEKMHAAVVLRCKHMFCEDCVSEWFERERTCPLCRALVKSADLKSFGDGSTSLGFQIF